MKEKIITLSIIASSIIVFSGCMKEEVKPGKLNNTEISKLREFRENIKILNINNDIYFDVEGKNFYRYPHKGYINLRNWKVFGIDHDSIKQKEILDYTLKYFHDNQFNFKNFIEQYDTLLEKTITEYFKKDNVLREKYISELEEEVQNLKSIKPNVNEKIINDTGFPFQSLTSNENFYTVKEKSVIDPRKYFQMYFLPTMTYESLYEQFLPVNIDNAYGKIYQTRKNVKELYEYNSEKYYNLKRDYYEFDLYKGLYTIEKNNPFYIKNSFNFTTNIEVIQKSKENFDVVVEVIEGFFYDVRPEYFLAADDFVKFEYEGNNNVFTISNINRFDVNIKQIILKYNGMEIDLNEFKGLLLPLTNHFVSEGNKENEKKYYNFLNPKKPIHKSMNYLSVTKDNTINKNIDFEIIVKYRLGNEDNLRILKAKQNYNLYDLLLSNINIAELYK